jgi:DNA-binding transcriptional MerR regulator
LILLREFSFESEVWQLLLLLQMLKLGTKLSSIQELLLLQQERKKRE